MRPLLYAIVLALLAGCGPTLSEYLQTVSAQCGYGPGTMVTHELDCQARLRSAIAAAGETPTRWHESLWAFRLLVAQKLDAGAISPAEARYAVTDYQRRLEVEANSLQAAQDSANAAELGNYLSVWRAYFPKR